MKWSSTAGPRQTKAVNQAINNLTWRGRSYRQITDHGECILTRPFAPPSEACTRAAEEIGERYGWSITRDNYRAVVAAMEAATQALEMPTVDTRSTPEQREARALADQQRAAAEAERKAAIDASRASLEAKRPPRAQALIVAELDENASDSMSDYFNHHTTRRVAIGWRYSAKEDFSAMRRAAAGFRETAHLGPGCDIYAPYHPDTREYYSQEGHPCGYGPHTTFSTLTEAGEWAKQHGITDVSWSKEEIEHREKWSMGSGYYLKAGHNHANGWRVHAVGLHCLNEHVYEDAIPEGGGTPADDGTADSTVGATVQQHHHTKRGVDYWLVVPNDRLDQDRFDALRAQCKGAGGWYSRKWGRVPGGFGFSTEDAAKAFAALV